MTPVLASDMLSHELAVFRAVAEQLDSHLSVPLLSRDMGELTAPPDLAHQLEGSPRSHVHTDIQHGTWGQNDLALKLESVSADIGDKPEAIAVVCPELHDQLFSATYLRSSLFFHGLLPVSWESLVAVPLSTSRTTLVAEGSYP